MSGTGIPELDWELGDVLKFSEEWLTTAATYSVGKGHELVRLVALGGRVVVCIRGGGGSWEFGYVADSALPAAWVKDESWPS